MIEIKKLITVQDSAQLARYFNDIKKYPLLDADQEKVEIAKAQKGDAPSLDKVVKANLRFVISVAKQYQGRGVPLQDLISEGNEGLIEAIKRFDTTRGIKFISYAVWWIRCGIANNFSKNTRLIHLPFNRTVLITKVRNVITKLEQLNGYLPAEAEIFAEFPDLSEYEVREAISLGNQMLSLDRPVEENGEHSTLYDILDSQNYNLIDEHENDGLKNGIAHLLQELGQQEIDILVLLYGLNGEETYTPNKLADAMGMRVSQIFGIRSQALKKLKGSPSLMKVLGI